MSRCSAVVRRTLDALTGSGSSPVGPIGWDRLALTTGSVTRTLPTPGVTTSALGLKTLVEGQYVHDHVLRQLELAHCTPDPAERRARMTFAVVGPGYAGTETAAQLQRMSVTQLHRCPRLSPEDLRWVLLDLAPSVLPELGPRLGRAALKVIRRRGMEMRLGTTVTAIDDGSVTLSDGTGLPAHTVVWTVARPLGVPLTGPAAKLITKAYHLYALPARPRPGWPRNTGCRPMWAEPPLGGRSSTSRPARSRDRSGATSKCCGPGAPTSRLDLSRSNW